MRLPELLALARSGEVGRMARDAVAARGEEAPAAAPAVDYVRFKPGTSCLFGLGTTTERPLGYVKLFLAGGADACLEKYRARERGDGRVERLPRGEALLFRFPLDRTVAALPAVVDPSRLKHVLHECVAGLGPDEERVRGRKSRTSILRYKPERRCLVRADLATRRPADGGKGSRSVVVQGYGDDSGARVWSVMRRLDGADRGALRVPRALGWSPSRRVLVQEFVPGRPWGERLHEPDAEVGAALAARMLRALHALPAPPDLPGSDAWAATAEAVRVLQDLGRVGDAEVTSAAADLAAALTRGVADVEPRPDALLHGDFHYHQLLVDGTDATLIDWDEARRGDPRQDVGNFVAHLHLRELQGRLDTGTAGRLCARFLGDVHANGTARGVAHFTALGLAKLALVPFRNLAPDWPQRSLAILGRARAIAAAPAEVRP